MKPDLNWGATILIAAAAAAGLSSRHANMQGGESAVAALTSKQSSSVIAKTQKQLPQDPCADIEEHLQEFLLGASRKSIAEPLSCYQSPPAPKDDTAAGAELRARAQHLHFMIATLPDPLHTHFSLNFDRLTESIQQGLADEDYVYDSSWLPWETEEPQLALIHDQDENDERNKAREEQPGILLFRKNIDPKTHSTGQPFDEGLIVFIVAEEPTHGIHRLEFENATAWIAALQPRTKTQLLHKLPEQILGPSFTGSIPSLANLLINASTQQRSNSDSKIALTIYSGSVTSSEAVGWLIDSTKASLDVRFASFQQNDDLAIERFCRYLFQSHFDLRRLAIISEDETAYGSAYARTPPCGPPSDGPAQLFYPRDISALRSAYQKESIFVSTLSQPSTDAPRHTLTTDIADPEGKEHDTIRDYSGNQTALSQEAVLQQIVNLLSAHQAYFILLRSSNPLDQLFLSHYLRLTYPQGRVVVAGADLLLRRESGADRLSGIMTLDTYPLLPWEAHWTRIKGQPFSHIHRVYPQDASEGTYIATRFLVHEPKIVPSALFLPTGPGLPIADYAAPFWLNEGTLPTPPPTWLSVLGRDNFWPLAAIDERSLPGPLDAAHPDPAPQEPSVMQRVEHLCGSVCQPIASMGRVLTFWRANTIFENRAGDKWYPWPAMPLSMTIALSIVFFWEIFHFACCCSPSVTIKPSHRAYFVCIPQSRRTYIALLVLGSLIFSAILTLLACGSGAMSPEGAPLPHPRLNLCFLLSMWVLAGLSLIINILKQPPLLASNANRVTSELSPHPPVKRTNAWHENLAIGKPLLGFVAGTVILYFLVYLSFEQILNSANRIPTYWRCMNLTSGVSPLVPLLALTAGVYMWFWYSLQGLAFFGPDRPALPCEETLAFKIEDEPRTWLRMFSRECAGHQVEAECWPFARPTLKVAAILFVVSAMLALLFSGGVPIRTLGARRYSIFVCLLMDACASLMLANAWQLLRIWINLRQLLTFLNRLKLRRSMATFHEITWGSVWKISGNVFDMRYRLLVNQLDCVTYLQNSIAELRQAFTPHADAANLAYCDQSFSRLNDARFSFAEWYSRSWNDPNAHNQNELEVLQACFAETTGNILASVLIPAWRREDRSLSYRAASEDKGDDQGSAEKTSDAAPGLEPHIHFAEQLVCLVYLGFIQNILGRMRSLVMGMLWMFVAATVSMASYPFDPRPVVSVAMVILFLALGTTIVFIYAQMHRDPILSLVTNTKPGELGTDFWLKLLGFGAGPALGLLATVFPEITDFLFSWVQPGMSSIK